LSEEEAQNYKKETKVTTIAEARNRVEAKHQVIRATVALINASYPLEESEHGNAPVVLYHVVACTEFVLAATNLIRLQDAALDKLAAEFLAETTEQTAATSADYRVDL
jgi:hypothetical protein